MDPLDPPPESNPRHAVRRAQGEFHPAVRRAPGVPFPVGPIAPLAHAILLAGATIAVFLAGRPQQGALGIFLLCAGGAMIFCPPRIAVPWRLWLAAGALTGCAALALLPARFFPQPAWRHVLGATPPIVLPDTISTTPALTVFWLTVLALSLLVGLFTLAQPIRSRWLLTFALAAAVAVGIYGALAIYARQTGWHYPFASDAAFGFFPNRNHTATFLCVGSLLALGVLGVVLREERWLLALLAGGIIAVCVSGLMFFSSSRGGVVFLLVGVGIWVAGLGRQHRDRRLVISFAAVLLAMGVLFLTSGGEARDRLLGKKPPAAALKAQAVPPASGAVDSEDRGHEASADFRRKVYQDAAAAIRDFPVTGMGLGTFPLVFAQYRQASLAEAAAIHPESDWLMFTAETGIPAVLCLLTLGALAVMQLRSERDHAYWPLRWGCAAAAGTAALHGMVDVPWHRVQLGWWMLVIAGLALQSARFGTLKRSRVQHGVFAVAGLAAVILGGKLIGAQWFGGPALPPFVAARAQAEILTTFNRPDAEAAESMAQRAVKVSPMVAPLYYQLGMTMLHFEDTDAEVDKAFKAQRLLDPHTPRIPQQQGESWLPVDPGRTAALWLEAMDRQWRVDQATGATPDRAVAIYNDMLARTVKMPTVQRALGAVAARSPAYALTWLDNATPEVVASDLGRLTGQDGLMRSIPARERPRFLVLWEDKGDHGALDRFVSEHPDWQGAAWSVHLRRLIAQRQFESAVRETAGHYHVSLQPPDAANAAPGTATSADPVLAAFEKHWREGNTVAARRTLEEVTFIAGQTPPAAEYWRLKAVFAAQDLAWEVAWQDLKRFVGQTQPAEILP